MKIRRVVRRLVQAPLFTVVAVITLAVGIGANAAIFSVIDGVLLRPLPFADLDSYSRTPAVVISENLAREYWKDPALAVALLLGVVGIYGVIAYVAAQRTREIGIRMALGADRGSVSRLFVRHGLLLTACGIASGLVAATFVTRLMAALLFGVSAVDPITYMAVAIGLAATAMLPTYLPARRASRIDPAVALRSGM